MLVVVKNKDVGAAIRKLKKKMFTEGVIKEVMDRRAYEKPSEKKRRERSESARRVRRDQLKRHKEYGI